MSRESYFNFVAALGVALRGEKINSSRKEYVVKKANQCIKSLLGLKMELSPEEEEVQYAVKLLSDPSLGEPYAAEELARLVWKKAGLPAQDVHCIF